MSENDVRTLNQFRERTMQAENTGDATFFEGASAEDVIVMTWHACSFRSDRDCRFHECLPRSVRSADSVCQ